jgi:6-phosphogluconolactonase
MTETAPGSSFLPQRLAGTSVSSLAAPNRGEPELMVVADPEAAADEAARRIVAAVEAAVERRGRADFCTTGGSTPIPIYRRLAQSPLADRIPWQQVHFWWGDDRFVPRDHPESNVTSLDDVLLGGGNGELGSAPLPAGNIHPFPTDRAIAESHDNGWCASQYGEEMARYLSLADGNWPVFDLILVGIGDDGHVLSVFPDSPALDLMDWAVGVPAPVHIGPHLPRVTVNPRLLEASPVLAVSSGAEKSAALGHIFGELRDERRWPAQRARRPGAAWIVDEAAATLIPAGRRG